ncbi:hypothetical protein DRN34_01485 [Thermococci archaeon]|nr:MAG: hypothetical protein DRN34_01485 [Thermococci archaeon]
MIRLGLDLHGVITVDPSFFSGLSAFMIGEGNEVYIVTGREDGDELRAEMTENGMENDGGRLYTNVLSITTYQKAIGTPIQYLDGRKSQPMMDPAVWNPTKAMLCATAGVDIMIDDSDIYEKYFRDIKTQYITYTPAVRYFLTKIFSYGGI